MKVKIPSFHQSKRYLKLFAVWLVAIGAVILLTTSASAEAAENALEIKVYRDPSCGCCGAWIEYLTTQGFQPKNIPISDIDAFKQEHGVPNDLVSCHTAVLNGYVIEGHVPAAEIKRLLAERPDDVIGITVPGMPTGTPGMESGNVRDPYNVFSFDQQGNTKIFSKH